MQKFYFDFEFKVPGRRKVKMTPDFQIGAISYPVALAYMQYIESMVIEKLERQGIPVSSFKITDVYLDKKDR